MIVAHRRFASRWPGPFAGSLVATVCLLAACNGAAPPRPKADERALRVALHAEPTSLDPHLQSESVANSLLSNLYEGLTSFDGEMGLRPALAERWESPDDLTWILRIRRGATFHDGRPVTAADVVASLERARDHPASRVSAFLVAVDSWRAVDRSTVELRTLRPYPILLNKLALILIVPAGSPNPIVDPVGTGPYRLAARATGRLELEPYARHWAGPPPHVRVDFTFEPDSARRAAGLLGGDFDLVTEVGPDERARVAASEVAELRERDTLTVNYLQLPGDVLPFSDPRVREALELAIDRRQLVAEMVGGVGSPVGQMVGPNVFGYVPGLVATERDLPRARQLLAEAGYPNGVDLELELRAGRSLEPLVRQLGEAGFRVHLQVRRWSELYPLLQSGAPLFYFGGWSCTSGDASDLFDGKVHTRSPRSGYGSQQGRVLSTPLLDRLIEIAGSASDMGERRRLLEQAARELAAWRLLLPLFVARTEYGVRRSLRFEPRLDGHVRAAEIRWRTP